MVVIDFFFFSIYIRCSRLRKFLIKMNSFVTAYTRNVNWWCCGCCHIFSTLSKRFATAEFVVSVFVSRVFIKIKYITTTLNFLANEEHVYSLTVRNSTYALPSCTDSVYVFSVCVWRKLIRDNSQMDNRLYNVHEVNVVWSIEAT